MARRNGFIGLMGFIAFALVGFAYMLFIAFGSGNVGDALMLVGQIIAFIIIGIIAFFYAFAGRSRNWKIACIIIWVVAAVFIVLALIFGMTGVR